MADKDLHARLTIYNFPKMSQKDRNRLVAWLIQQLEAVEFDNPANYAERYTARLFK